MFLTSLLSSLGARQIWKERDTIHQPIVIVKSCNNKRGKSMSIDIGGGRHEK